MKGGEGEYYKKKGKKTLHNWVTYFSLDNWKSDVIKNAKQPFKNEFNNSNDPVLLSYCNKIYMNDKRKFVIEIRSIVIFY